MPRQIKKRSKTIESRKNDLLTDNNQPRPKITLPWPPAVTCDDFVRNRPLTKVDIKSPNSFFVYRTAFVKQLLIEQHKFKMTQVSKWASMSWQEESEEVKKAYKAIAQKIDKELQEKRKAIKGYRIVCENFDSSDDSEQEKPQEKQESQGNKQENIEKERSEGQSFSFIEQYPQHSKQPVKNNQSNTVSSPELSNLQPPPPPQQSQHQFIHVFSPTSTTFDSDSLTCYNSPISPKSPPSPFIKEEDFEHSINSVDFINDHNDNHLGVYLSTDNTYDLINNCNLCITPTIFNTSINEVYSTIGDVNVCKPTWNQDCFPNSEYYTATPIYIEQGSSDRYRIIENSCNEYLPWDC